MRPPQGGRPRLLGPVQTPPKRGRRWHAQRPCSVSPHRRSARTSFRRPPPPPSSTVFYTAADGPAPIPVSVGTHLARWTRTGAVMRRPPGRRGARRGVHFGPLLGADEAQGLARPSGRARFWVSGKSLSKADATSSGPWRTGANAGAAWVAQRKVRPDPVLHGEAQGRQSEPALGRPASPALSSVPPTRHDTCCSLRSRCFGSTRRTLPRTTRRRTRRLWHPTRVAGSAIAKPRASSSAGGAAGRTRRARTSTQGPAGTCALATAAPRGRSARKGGRRTGTQSAPSAPGRQRHPSLR